MRLIPVLLLLALTACSGGAEGFEIVREGNVVSFIDERQAAPAVEGEMLVGDPVSTAGAVTVVNFWGSWCGPCRSEQPILEGLWNRFEPDGVVFIGVNVRRDQRAAALAFIEEFDVTYPSIYDPSSRIAHAFRVRAMPSTYVLDRAGDIAAAVFGAVLNEADLASVIEREVGA